MKTFKKSFLVVIFFSLTFFGCAFGTRHVILNPISTSLSLDASGQNVFVEVNDKRAPDLKPVVGHVKNGYGMKTAKVLADKEVSAWVRNSIVEELKRFGASIITSEINFDNNAKAITVDVLVCYAQAYMRYGGEVTVTLNIKRDGEDIIKEKTYTGKAILGTNWAAKAASFQKVLEMAMDDLLQKLIPDIVIAIKS